MDVSKSYFEHSHAIEVEILLSIASGSCRKCREYRLHANIALGSNNVVSCQDFRVVEDMPLTVACYSRKTVNAMGVF